MYKKVKIELFGVQLEEALPPNYFELGEPKTTGLILIRDSCLNQDDNYKSN